MRLLILLMTLSVARPRLWGRLFGPAPATVEPLRVRLRATSRMWTEVRVDGDPEYSRWMEPEQELELEAQQEVYVWCAQADKLVVTVNDEPSGTLASLTDTPSRTPAWYTFRNDEPLEG